MKKTLLTTVKTSTILIGGALMAQAAWASGYHFGTQSVSSQATANASAAEAADPSTLFYNPAGLTKLEGTQATININLVAPSVKYSGASAEYPAVPLSATTTYPKEKVQGQDSGSIDPGLTVVPHMYASHKLNDQIALGLGVYVPFGSGTDYDEQSVLRYNLNKLGLQTMALQPTVAFKLNDQHSFAVGLVAQHTKAELRQFANFGPAVKRGLATNKAAVDAQAATALPQLAAGIAQVEAGIAQATAANAPASVIDPLKAQLVDLKTKQATLVGTQQALNSQLANMPGVGNGAADGYAKVEGGDWGFGYNLAWLWDINDSARVGVNYRSKISHNLRGDAEWILDGDAFQNAALGGAIKQQIRDRGYKVKEDASVKITTPESLSVHGMYKINPQWNLFGDVTWTRHSRFNKAELIYDNPKDVTDPTTGNATSVKSDRTILNPNWRNTYKVSLGASYQVSEPLQLRFGWAYDQSPVKSADYRMSTLPDANRMWFSVGGKYDINKNNSINVAYSYLNIQNSKANMNGWCGANEVGAGSEACVSSRTNGSASFKSHAHILGLQYTYKF